MVVLIVFIAVVVLRRTMAASAAAAPGLELEAKGEADLSFDDEGSFVSSSIVQLNIGGTKFETTEQTLSKSGYFKALLSGKHADKRKEYFIDRNARYFEYVLDYMRYGRVSIPSSYALMVQSEAAFYQIHMDLSDVVEKLSMPVITIQAESEDRNWQIEINGRKLRDVYQQYLIDEETWEKKKGARCYKLRWILNHLITQCAYFIFHSQYKTKTGKLDYDFTVNHTTTR